MALGPRYKTKIPSQFRKREERLFPIEVFVEMYSTTQALFEKSREDIEEIKKLIERWLLRNKIAYEIFNFYPKPRGNFVGYKKEYLTLLPVFWEETYIFQIVVRTGRDKIHEIKKGIEKEIEKYYREIGVGVLCPVYAPWLQKYLGSKEVSSLGKEINKEESNQEFSNLWKYIKSGEAEATA